MRDSPRDEGMETRRRLAAIEKNTAFTLCDWQLPSASFHVGSVLRSLPLASARPFDQVARFHVERITHRFQQPRIERLQPPA